VNSVGTARRDQREIDPVTFQRADIIVVDTRDGVFGEAGDALAAKDVISPDQVHELSEILANGGPGRSADDQITLFKSVGTGVQDIGLAAMVYRQARDRGLGTEFPDFPFIKRH
jgi:ornithine cyclodeaminase/alanine dehydrogenase-like protein (mu-crystallin family)